MSPIFLENPSRDSQADAYVQTDGQIRGS